MFWRFREESEVSLMAGNRGRAPIHSSAAEYLTFAAASGGSDARFVLRYEDENIWLTQKMMAALYDVSVAAVNQHLRRIFSDGSFGRRQLLSIT